MATQQSRSAARVMMAPAVVLLLGWMLVRLILTLFFSFKKYLPIRGDNLADGLEWVGFDNYIRFVQSSTFWPSIQATLVIVAGVLVITVVGGILLALLLDQPMSGQGIVRILVIAPFFVMPTVSALVWKNMFLDPVNGLFAHLWRAFGAEPVVWLSDASLQSIVMIVAWQWLPFATLIRLTAIQSLDSEQLEAAEMDGATLKAEILYVLTPMAVPGIASTLLLNFILAWNEAFWTLNLTVANAAPLTAFIVSYSSPEGLFFAKLSAASTMAIAPILILGWFSQKQLVRGLTFGAVK